MQEGTSRDLEFLLSRCTESQGVSSARRVAGSGLVEVAYRFVGGGESMTGERWRIIVSFDPKFLGLTGKREEPWAVDGGGARVGLTCRCGEGKKNCGEDQVRGF